MVSSKTTYDDLKNKKIKDAICETEISAVANYDLPESDKKRRSNFYTNRVVCNAEIEMHSHNYIEIAFVEDGSGFHQMKDDMKPCGKGDMFLMNSDIKHRFIPDEGSFLIIRNCIFLPDFFDCSLIGNKNFQTLSNKFLFRPFFMEKMNSTVEIHIPESDFKKITGLFEDILSEYETKQSGYLELIRAYMIELLIYILRKLEIDADTKASPFANNKVNEMITKKVLAYIGDHFSDDLTIEDLSMLAFLSPAQFCRVFKQTTGFTVKEFMQKTRVEIACGLLNDKTQTIANIANSVGYHDVKYFNKVFIKITGLTPSKMREDIRKV